MKRMITVLEAVQIFGLSSKKIRQGCSEKWIPHVKTGNKILVDSVAFAEILSEKSAEGAQI